MLNLSKSVHLCLRWSEGEQTWSKLKKIAVNYSFKQKWCKIKKYVYTTVYEWLNKWMRESNLKCRLMCVTSCSDGWSDERGISSQGGGEGVEDEGG